MGEDEQVAVHPRPNTVKRLPLCLCYPRFTTANLLQMRFVPMDFLDSLFLKNPHLYVPVADLPPDLGGPGRIRTYDQTIMSRLR